MLERWRVYCLIFLVAVLCNGLVVMRANGQESSVAQLQEQASDILRIISSSDPDSSLTAENHLTAFAKKYGTAAQKVLEQEIRSDISRPEEREALSVALFRVRNDKDPRQLLVEELRKITGIAGDAKTFGRISGIEDKAVLDLFPNTCIFLLRERSSAVSYRNLSQQNLLVVWSTGEVQVVSNPTDLKLLLMHSPSMIIDEQVAREVIEAWFRLATALSQREGFRFTIAEEAFQRNAGTWSIHAKATVDPTDGNTGFLEMSVKTGPSGRIEEATTQTSLSSGWVDIVTSPQNVFGFEVPMLVLLILAFIVGFFMFHLIGYWTAIAKVSGQLNEGKNIASAYSMPIIGPDKAKLDEEFKSLPALSVAWGEFSETLLPHQDAEQTVYFNTKPAGEFINVESVLDKKDRKSVV